MNHKLVKKIMTVMSLILFCGSNLNIVGATENMDSLPEIEKKDYQKTTTDLQNLIVETDKKLDELKKKKQGLEESLEKLKEKKQTDISELEKQISEVNQKISELSAEKAVKEANMTTSTDKTELEGTDLKDEIDALKLEIKSLTNQKEMLEEQVATISSELSGKTEKMTQALTQLENDQNELKKQNDEYQQQLDTLRTELDSLINDYFLPEDISLDQWYPEKVVTYPKKKSYQDGETIDLDGLHMRFRRVVKKNGKYVEEFKKVSYQELQEGYRGWQFKLETTVAKYNAETDGKMKINFKLVLTDIEQSMN